jgi:rod shape-determining protein MreD
MEWTKQIGRYILVMVLQVLLFDQLQLWGACHPYIYLLCLLMMPITLPPIADMLIGGIIGLIMDMFCNSLGVHTASCILIMFLRPYLLGVILNDKDRLNEQVSLRSIGMEAFIKYVVIMVVVHHLTVFSLAAWSWYHIGFVLLETVVSSVITIFVIIGYNILKYR